MKLLIAALAMLSTSAFAQPAFAQQRDAYGNIIPADVVRHRAEEARRDAIAIAMRERRVIPGMTEQEVRTALGEPATINDNAGQVQWVYEHTDRYGRVRTGTTYVYFRDGLTR